MGDASSFQPHMQGGEISPFSQGRLDDPTYKTSLNVCRNSMPLEEGGWTRRSGTRFCAPTWQGLPAVLRSFHFNATNPYTVELTDGLARIFDGPTLILDSRHNVTTISSANPAQITTNEAHTWANGDEVMFFRNAGDTNFTPGLLLNRYFQITVIDTSNFTIADAVTGEAFDGSTVTLGATNLGVGRVLHMTSPYTGKGTPKGMDGTKLVQGPNFAILLHPKVPPQILATQTDPSQTSQGVFAFQQLQLNDGPYFDEPTDGSQVAPSGTSGSITVSITLNVWDPTHTYAIGDVVNFDGLGYTSLTATNLGNEPDNSSSFWQLNVTNTGTTQAGFFPTDVGRSIRFFSEPPEWDAGFSFTAGQTSKWQGAYWVAIASTTGEQPDISPAAWQVSPGAAVWSWGIITAYTDAGHVTVSIQGGALINTNAMVYRLGVFSDTTGWPSCGVYTDGRLWLAGVLPNRIDGSFSNQPFNFQPTLADGTVTDANAIAAPFQSTTNNAVYWLAEENQGVVIGTKGGEFVAQASNLNQGLTPSTIMVRRTTKFGVEDQQPIRAPMALIFTQRHSRKLIEYISDVYSAKFSGTNLAKKTGHLTAKGIAELAYQQETVPTLWMRMNDGSLKGAIYKRESPFGTQPAEFNGWHRHDHGQGRTYESIQSGPSMNGGDTDTIMVVTSDGTTRWVEMLANQYEVGDDISQGFFVDGGTPATAGEITGGDHLHLAGYYYMAGKTIDFQIAGLDMGQVTVAADGTVSIPFANNSVFSTTYLAGVTAKGLTYDTHSIILPVATTAGVPDITGIQKFLKVDGVITGMNYNSGAFDWDHNQALIGGGGVGDGMMKYRLTTGAEFTYRTKAQWDKLLLSNWNPPVYDTSGLYFPGTMTAGNGIAIWPSINQFFIPASISNNQFLRIGHINALTPVVNAFKLAVKLGRNEAGLATNGSIPGSGEIVAVTAGARHYAVTIPVYNIGAGQLNVIDIDLGEDVSPTFSSGGNIISSLSFGHVDNGVNSYYIRGCAGYQSQVPFYNYAEVCLIGHTVPGIGVQSSIIPLHVGRVIIQGLPNDNTSSFVIDAGNMPASAWNTGPGLNISAIMAPVYDPLDGNIICGVTLGLVPNWNGGTAYLTNQQAIGSNNHAYKALSSTTGNDPTTDAGVHWQDLGVKGTAAKYITKVDPRTATVVWKTAVSSLPTGDASHNQTRLTGFGSYCIALGDGLMSDVNTVTGAITSLGSIDHIGASIHGQAYDDTTGRLAISCDYNTAIGTHGPAPVGGTPNSFSNSWAVFAGVPGVITNYTFPALGGFSYVSQGQTLRPLSAEDSGARNGPALGKTRRLHQYAALLAQTQGISFGTNFTDQINLTTLAAYEGGPATTADTLYNGVIWDTVADDYGYDGMLCWQVTRPLPATVLSVESFLHTQDR